jgi:hypothetical protein
MGILKKSIIIFSYFLFIVFISISFYLNIKGKTISEPLWKEFHQYISKNTVTIAGEGHMSPEAEKKAGELFFKAQNSKEQKLSARYYYYCYISIIISIILFFIALLMFMYNYFKKIILWLCNNPRKSILYFAVIFFLSSWLFTPFIHSGQIYYSFILIPFWNGSRIFWALMLVEWTIVMLPLVLIYKRLNNNAKSASNNQ